MCIVLLLEARATCLLSCAQSWTVGLLSCTIHTVLWHLPTLQWLSPTVSCTYCERAVLLLVAHATQSLSYALTRATDLLSFALSSVSHTVLCHLQLSHGLGSGLGLCHSTVGKWRWTVHGTVDEWCGTVHGKVGEWHRRVYRTVDQWYEPPATIRYSFCSNCLSTWSQPSGWWWYDKAPSFFAHGYLFMSERI